MKNFLLCLFFLLILFTMSTHGQLTVKNSAGTQVAVITQSGKVGFGTSEGVEPLGKLEVRETNLKRIYLDGGNLRLGDILRSEADASNIHHYLQVNGSGWDQNSNMYWSGILSPGHLIIVYNRAQISRPAPTSEVGWFLHSSVVMPKYKVIAVNDYAINYYQPHVAPNDYQDGPNRFNFNLTNGDLTIQGQGYKPGGGSWASSSDVRLKEIKGSYQHGLEQILQLRPVKYNYKMGNVRNYPTDKEYVGFIAQEVQKVLPEAVSAGADGYLNLDMHPIHVAMVNAIKEQQAQIETLKAENARLTAKLGELADLQNEIKMLKAVLSTEGKNPTAFSSAK